MKNLPEGKLMALIEALIEAVEKGLITIEQAKREIINSL